LPDGHPGKTAPVQPPLFLLGRRNDTAALSWGSTVASSGERIHIGTHLALITEHNKSGPGAYILGVEFDGVTGMTGNEDRDWPVLDPAFGLAERLGCAGIWFKHPGGVEFVTQSAESAQRCRELASRG
jgi:hypothetical protein